ncbi:DUF2795 domain-containing protein [Dactylosporangium salmoneum]|uniref:DUF2795 domain-containing protein n=1 Tax=Dactylosporangium salmoneum TaxID=53361 RepID=A0ABN3GVI7_9ACTN
MTASAIEVQRYLDDVDYPTDKRHLVEQARDNGANEKVMRTLQDLPRDRFASPNDVTQAIGEPSKQYDVVEILLARHTEIKQMFTRVSSAQGRQKEELFHELVRMLAVHENAEEIVVHPAARDLIPTETRSSANGFKRSPTPSGRSPTSTTWGSIIRSSTGT